MLNFKYRYTEIGYGQVHYTVSLPNNHTLYYCLMEEFHDVVDLYSCSEDGEADCPVKFKPNAQFEFETPPDLYGQGLLKNYLNGIGVQA